MNLKEANRSGYTKFREHNCSILFFQTMTYPSPIKNFIISVDIVKYLKLKINNQEEILLANRDEAAVFEKLCLQ